MAEEKLQYTLTLATVASGTGASETAAGMAKVEAAKAKVSDMAAKVGEKLVPILMKLAGTSVTK